MELEGIELVSVYLLLVKNEDILDSNQLRIKIKTEKELFNKLSIDEIERLGDLYENKVDVLRKKL